MSTRPGLASSQSAASSAASTVKSAVLGTSSGGDLLSIAKTVGAELLIVAILVIIAGQSNGAANVIIWLFVALWVLAGITYFAKKG